MFRNGNLATNRVASLRWEAVAEPKMKAVTYDVAEQLRTPEEMAAYLEAWFQEAPDDAAGIARALGDIARARRSVKAD